MEYPFWLVPGIGKGLIIGVISVLHVFVAQFAVGGGVYLAWMEGRAEKLQSPELLQWLEKHTRFFLLLTMVFGGVSGVAIWFAMTVVSPAGTYILVSNFVFIWAAEWTFFLVEIVTLLAYYYTYPLRRDGRFSARLHMRIGWLYAFAGFMSLFLINGIITYMLTPGQSLETGRLIHAFFNPTFWPSLVFRFALCLLLAGMFALFTAARLKNETIKRSVTRSAALWVALPLLPLAASTAWYYFALPPDRQLAMTRRTLDIYPFAKAYGWILPIILIGSLFAFVRAERLRTPLTIAILCSGLALVGSFEWIRETGRRPWLVPGIVYSNGMTVAEKSFMDKRGISAISGWSNLLADSKASRGAKVTRGEFIFEQQCGTCHGINGPRLDIVPLLERYSPAGMAAQLAGQGKRLTYMPPFSGNSDDITTLAEFLNSLRGERERKSPSAK